MRPEFFWFTIGVLLLLQLPLPRNLKIRFCLRLTVTLFAVGMWGYNAGFFSSFWGYEGPFYEAFSMVVLPLDRKSVV